MPPDSQSRCLKDAKIRINSSVVQHPATVLMYLVISGYKQTQCNSSNSAQEPSMESITHRLTGKRSQIYAQHTTTQPNAFFLGTVIAS